MGGRIPRDKRSIIAFAHDMVMAAVAFVLSLGLRLGWEMTEFVPLPLIYQGAIAFSVIAAGVFWFMGLYRGIWRYASINDLVAITKAVSLAILIFFLVFFLWTRLEELPRSIPIINWFILMALLGGPRFLYRIIKDRRFDIVLEHSTHPRIPVLLAGAGDGAELFLRAAARSSDTNYRVVGILSETVERVGRRIHGVEVLGTLNDLYDVVQGLEKRDAAPTRIVVTKENMDGATVRSLLDEATRMGMTLARLPKLTDFKSGAEDTVQIRDIAVEDLLGRPQKPLNRDAMGALIKDKRVIVTGAGGSIGSELVRQAAAFGPTELILVESSEFALYTIDMELSRRWPDVPRRAIICDVRDRDRLDALFANTKPEIVFHAAALKHVPLVEDNPSEGVRTNVLGTINVAETAVSHNVEAMVMISTDKAVNPTNVMGATKRIAEQYIQALDISGTNTRFVTVRFGNVLGSTGSVVPLFRKQLADGGPLTVTHPDMTRYFMTIREAVELVLQAAAFDGQSGHANDGKIYVLDMGEPVKIIDLARQMIRLAGFEPDKDIEIKIVGTRPGEKLFEEVFHGAEAPIATDAPGILLAAPRAGDLANIKAAVTTLSALTDSAAIKTAIRTRVPEYTPDI